MKKQTSAVMAIVFALMLSLSVVSCKNDEPNPDPNTQEIFEKYVKNGVIQATILREKLVLPENSYVLDGALTIEEGGELHLAAGSTIKANKGFDKYILVARGGKIFAEGTASKPITFTANATYANEANEGQGHWGGIIINGYAGISSPEGQVAEGKTEIDNAYVYGGSNDADNSGVLRYVKIEYGGAAKNEEVEHNGLTLNGVGSGTVVENLFILNSSDDAVEFFGGSVNVKNLLAINSEDDLFDFTQGYNGTLENCYGIWEEGFYSGEKDPRGVEADGNLDGNNKEYVRQSDFVLRNMTIDLRLVPKTDKTTDHGAFMDDVLKVRRGAKIRVENALITGKGAAEDLIDLTDGKSDAAEGCVINITNALTTPVFGKEVKASDASKHTIHVGTGNAGCDKGLFVWTGYQF